MPDGPHARLPSLGFQEGELGGQFMKLELQASAINKSDY